MRYFVDEAYILVMWVPLLPLSMGDVEMKGGQNASSSICKPLHLWVDFTPSTPSTKRYEKWAHAHKVAQSPYAVHTRDTANVVDKLASRFQFHTCKSTHEQSRLSNTNNIRLLGKAITSDEALKSDATGPLPIERDQIGASVLDHLALPVLKL